MKSHANFKNPDDGSEIDELDELVEDVDELGVPVVVAVAGVNDTDSDIEEASAASDAEFWRGEGNENNVGDDNEISSDDSFDVNATDSDESMSESESDAAQQNSVVTNRRRAQNKNDGDGPGTSSGAVEQNDEDPVSVYDMNEDQEDDETVRAIIAAIKKPRTSPPEIKLEDFITDICFHPERNIIALATIIGDVYLYKYANEGNTLLRSIEVHGKACRDVEFTDDGSKLLTCSKDKCVMVTDMNTEKLVKFYETAHDEAINKLHIIDEHLFATGDDSGVVKLWDLRTKVPIFELKEIEDQITQLLTNDAKKLLLATSGDGYLTTFNIGARKLYVQSEPYEEELNCMGIYRGDSKLVVGTSKGRLYTYNWGQFGYHCDMYPGIKTPINEMIPITDRIACVGGEEGIIRACHIAPYRNLGIVGQHNMPIECLDVNCNGELIASSSHNNDVRFWNVKYFEDFGDIKYNEKHNTFREKRHNLPSSKATNASDFFADMAQSPDDDEGQ